MQLSKLFARFNNKHFYSLTGNVVMSGLALIINGILYRKLPGKTEMGIWVLFQTILALVDTFRSGFLTTAAIKFYSGASKERAAEVIGSTWYLSSIITGVLLLLNLPALFLLQYIHHDGIAFFIKWFGITFLATLPVFIANCVLQAEERFDRLLYLRMVNQVSFLAFIIYLVVTHNLTLQTVVYSNLVASVITSVFVLTKGWTHLNSWTKRTRKGVMELYNFGKYSVGTVISATLLRSSDTLIIGFMLGEGPVAVYSIGLRSLEVVEIPLRSFIATAMPSLSVAYNQNKMDYFLYLVKKYTGMLTIALIPVAVVAWFSADLVALVFGGQKYLHSEAGNVIRIFMTFAILFPIDRFMALALDVLHLPHINFRKVLLMLASNIIFDFAGIFILHNIYGVALATIFPTLIGGIVGYVVLRKQLPFNLVQLFSTGYTELKILTRQTLQNLKLLRSQQ